MFMREVDQFCHPFARGLLSFGAAFCILTIWSASASIALAQDVATPPMSAASSVTHPSLGTPSKKASALNISSTSGWQELTPAQQLSLSPLAESWNRLGESQKRKWIAIAKNYPALAPAEQEKLHSRMTEWVSLSQQQRTQARLNFAQAKRLTPAQKAATWQAYQALSPEEKQKLAISVVPKPAGAAAVTKPIPPQKLAAVPVTKQTPKQMPRISVSHYEVNRKTLLPLSKTPIEPATAQKN
jgi:predicted RNA-binding Zn ribbon-like protein